MRNVLAVVVNYQTPELVLDCLRSLALEVAAEPGLLVVVVDNASADDSVVRIQSELSARDWSWARLLALDANAGFAAGCNAAIRPALVSAEPPDYVLLLNSDTLVRPGAIGALVRLLEQRPEVGIVGSRLEDRDGTPQCSAFRFPSIAGELEAGLRLGPVSRLLARWVVAPPVSDVQCAADWVAGAALMARRTVFETAGLLDERYFLYYEEVDFCRRARCAGWRCWYVPESRVVHLRGRSSGVTDPRRRDRRPAYWFESRRRYFLTHHGVPYTAAADAAYLLGYSLWRLRRRIQRLPDQDPVRLLEDFTRHSIFCRGWQL